MVHLVMRMYCNWPTDQTIDHGSIGLNRLTIQLVFNEVSLFIFSKETRGFDVTVPKNYLKNVQRVIDLYAIDDVISFKEFLNLDTHAQRVVFKLYSKSCFDYC